MLHDEHSLHCIEKNNIFTLLNKRLDSFIYLVCFIFFQITVRYFQDYEGMLINVILHIRALLLRLFTVDIYIPNVLLK